jgi:hypothetical protein
MKGITIAVLFGALVGAALTCHAVPPAYVGQFGNPEEPALRVIKWPWLGLRKMVMHTHEGLKSGIQCSPVDAVCEGAHGAAKGSCILLDHTGRGLIYSKLPPKGPLNDKTTYEEKALAYINSETVSGQGTVPAGNAEAAKPAVDENGNPYLTVKVKEKDVSKAQRHYVPLRTVQRDRSLARRENLLRLAR